MRLRSEEILREILLTLPVNVSRMYQPGKVNVFSACIDALVQREEALYEAIESVSERVEEAHDRITDQSADLDKMLEDWSNR